MAYFNPEKFPERIEKNVTIRLGCMILIPEKSTVILWNYIS